MNNKTKKNKTTIQVYTQPIYGIHNIVVIVSNDINSITKTVDPVSSDIQWKPENWVDYDGLTFSRVKYKGKVAVCIYLHPEQFSDTVDNVAAHESFHASAAILEHAGVTLSTESEESFAYLVGWIDECVMNTYHKWLKK